MKNLRQHLLFLSALVILLSCEGNGNKDQSTEGMVQHTVYFYLSDNISEPAKKQFEEGLQKLLSIDVIYQSEMGKTGSTPPREVADHGFDYSIFTWFKNLDDYEIYATHPDHMEFIKTFESYWTEVKVYDSEILNEKR